jgi:hypothetical protein
MKCGKAACKKAGKCKCAKKMPQRGQRTKTNRKLTKK